MKYVNRFETILRKHRSENGNFTHSVELHDRKTKKVHRSSIKNGGSNDSDTTERELLKMNGYKASRLSLLMGSHKTIKVSSEKQLLTGLPDEVKRSNKSHFKCLDKAYSDDDNSAIQYHYAIINEQKSKKRKLFPYEKEKLFNRYKK